MNQDLVHTDPQQDQLRIYCCGASSGQLFVSHGAQVKGAALELGYQPTPTFCLKVSQLREIFEVRWSVFLLGPAGCGKSAVWKTLLKAQNDFGEKTIYRPINPKVPYIHVALTRLHT